MHLHVPPAFVTMLVKWCSFLSNLFLHCNHDDVCCSVWQIGWLTLTEEFNRMLGSGHSDKDRDVVYDNLKAAVRDESMKKHKWDEKAEDSLVRLSFMGRCLLLF